MSEPLWYKLLTPLVIVGTAIAHPMKFVYILRRAYRKAKRVRDE